MSLGWYQTRKYENHDGNRNHSKFMLKSAFVIVQRLLSVFPRICLMVQKNVSNLRQ